MEDKIKTLQEAVKQTLLTQKIVTEMLKHDTNNALLGFPSSDLPLVLYKWQQVLEFLVAREMEREGDGK